MLFFTGIFSNTYKKHIEQAIKDTNFISNQANQLNQINQTQIIADIQQKQILQNLQKYSQTGGYSTNLFLVSKYFELTKSKKELLKEIDDIKDFYMSQLIVNRIIEDALTPSIDNNFFIPSVVINGQKDESLTELVKDLTNQLSLKKIILDVAADVLFYGEAFLRVDVNDYYSSNNKGIINIHDDVDSTSIIPVFRDSEVSYYLKLNLEKKKIETVQNTNYIYFHLPSNRIRVKLNGLDDKVLYIRMGQSVLYPVYSLLKELKFFEELIPTAMIKKLKKSKLVGVSVPSSTKPQDAIEIARIYQKMVDTALAKDDNYDDMESMLKSIQSKMGSIKVIPVWNDKGELQTQDIEDDEKLEELQDKIQDLRELILRTLGLPVNLITQDQDILKSDIIKSYNMYTRKLKMIQEALAYGLKQIYTIHLQNLGFTDISLNDIHIIWNNTLDYESLQRIELIDILVASFENTKQFIEDMEGDENIEVNKKDYVEYLNSQFKNIVGFDLFKYKDEEEE